jgi:hypothetical protein
MFCLQMLCDEGEGVMIASVRLTLRGSKKYRDAYKNAEAIACSLTTVRP